MKAVNLVPSEARKAGTPSLKLAPATYGLLGVLAAAVVLVTLYVLANNSVSSKQSEIASLQAQVTQAQSEATQLGPYGQFAALAQTRLQTVKGIAATRFDWHGALSELSRVIPTNTSLQSLTATVVPGASVGGSGGSGGGLRSDLPGPAFEMTGCTHTQDDVARFISRLRVMTGVSRVALGSSTKISNASASNTGSTSGRAHPRGCPANAPSFDLIVYFQPVTDAGPTGATAVPGASTSATTGGAQ